MDLKTEDLSEQFFEKLLALLTSDEESDPTQHDPEFWSRGLTREEVDTCDFMGWMFMGVVVSQACKAQHEDAMDQMEWMFVSAGLMDKEMCLAILQIADMIEHAGTEEVEYDIDAARAEINDEDALERFDATCSILEQFEDIQGLTPTHLYRILEDRVERFNRDL